MNKTPLTTAEVFSQMPSGALTTKPLFFLSLFVPLGSNATRFGLYQTLEGAFFNYHHSAPLVTDNLVELTTKIEFDRLESTIRAIEKLIVTANLEAKHYVCSSVKDPSEFCVLVNTSVTSYLITAIGFQGLPELKSLYRELMELLKSFVDHEQKRDTQFSLGQFKLTI